MDRTKAQGRKIFPMDRTGGKPGKPLRKFSKNKNCHWRNIALGCARMNLFDTDQVLVLTLRDHLKILFGGAVCKGRWVATRGRIRLKSEETMLRERDLIKCILQSNPYIDADAPISHLNPAWTEAGKKPHADLDRGMVWRSQLKSVSDPQRISGYPEKLRFEDASKAMEFLEHVQFGRQPNWGDAIQFQVPVQTTHGLEFKYDPRWGAARFELTLRQFPNQFGDLVCLR